VLVDQQIVRRREMTSLRAVLPLALVTAVVAVAPAVASTQPTAPAGSAPVAHTAGGDAPLPLPAIVNVRVVRAQNLLQHATKYEDLGQPDKAVTALTAARSNMTKAWTATQYLIANAPPPAEPASVRPATAVRKTKTPAKAKRRSIPVVKAHSSDAAVPVYADIYTTAAAVISLQHAVATTAMGMMDNAAEPLLTAVSKNLFAALNARDGAIAYIHSIAPPPVAADGSVHAHASGAPIGGSWDTIMPNVVPDVDDELQQIAGIRATIKLSPGRARLLNDAELQDRRTETTLNTYWPPVPAG
jgi:hypothetical protein